VVSGNIFATKIYGALPVLLSFFQINWCRLFSYLPFLVLQDPPQSFRVCRFFWFSSLQGTVVPLFLFTLSYKVSPPAFLSESPPPFSDPLPRCPAVFPVHSASMSWPLSVPFYTPPLRSSDLPCNPLFLCANSTRPFALLPSSICFRYHSR